MRDVTLMYSKNFDETYISKSSMNLENQVTLMIQAYGEHLSEIAVGDDSDYMK